MRLSGRYRTADLFHTILLAFSAAFAAGPFLSGLSSRADLVTQFLLQGAAFTFLLALFSFLWRCWKQGLGHVALLLVQIVFLQPSLSPKSAEADVSTLRLVFTNLWADNRMKRAAIGTLERLDPDILVMVEMVGGWREALAPLASTYSDRADCFRLSGCDVVLLSRFPIMTSDTPVDRWHRSRAVYARIETPLGALDVVGTHMTRPLPIGQVYHQERHAELLTELAGKVSGPMVLAGDFNAVPWGRVVRQIERDSRLVVHRGLEGTWPSAMPWPFRLPIDHVFVDDSVEIVSREVINMPGSDHNAVVIDLRLKQS